MRRFLALLLLAFAAVPSAWASARALKDVRGIVEEVTVEERAGAAPWTVLAVLTPEGDRFRVGLASEDVLEAEGFGVAVGDPVRVRFFADGDPHEVQRLRNEATGRVLRLRCLHGDPLWRDRGGRGAGPGAGRGGPRR